MAGSINGTIDDCTKFFRRFKYRCVFAIKIFHETHGKTSCFTLSKRFKNQNVEITGQMIYPTSLTNLWRDIVVTRLKV